MDVLLLPFKVLPQLPMLLALNAALGLATYPAAIGVSRLVYGPEKTAQGRPYFRRFAVACAIGFPIVAYAMTFVFMTLLGWQS